MRKTGDDGWGGWEKEYWWQPFIYPFSGKTVEELQEWLWDESIVPPLEQLLEVSDKNNLRWLVLKSFSNWKKEPEENQDTVPHQDAWYRINSCIVRKDQLEPLKKALAGKALCDPGVLRSESTGHQGYFREFPWHPIYKDMEGWSTYMGHGVKAEIDNLIPSSIYEWEHGSSDYSLDKSISIYMPSKDLIEELNLHPGSRKFGEWLNSDEEVIFFDPSVDSDGPSSALVNKDTLFEWLEQNELSLVWLIGGEKQLFTHWAHKFFGRLNYNGLYVLGEDGVKGDLWFERNEPFED